jgi:Protein of unknown function (DUF1570)
MDTSARPLKDNRRNPRSRHNRSGHPFAWGLFVCHSSLKMATQRVLLVGLLLRGLAGLPARAELIYFKKGVELQAPARLAGSRVIIELPGGDVEFLREDIRLLVPGFWPAREWETRQEQVRTAGFESRYAAVWWAIENGLTAEVIPELRALHRFDPSHAASSRMLAVLDCLARDCSDGDFSAFQKVLGVETKVARGTHILLLHQHPEAEARERIALLERVITGYYLLMAEQGIELKVPQHRLVSAWFANHKDYLAFLHSQGADAFATTRGYFHPTWNAVVAYDARSSEKQLTARDVLRERRDDVVRFGALVERAPARGRLRVKLGEQPVQFVGRNQAKTLLARLDREITCETMMLDLEQRAIDLGTAAHEMIHQLAMNSGLIARQGVFPYWLHEGFAAQFEVIRGGTWAGISRAHDLRLLDWRRLEASPKLERLVRDGGFGRGYQRDLYAQAWALVYYLRTQHAQGFLTFIDLLRSPGRGDSTQVQSTSDSVFEAFERAFGPDLDALERDWLRFMETVRTPLEQHAPAVREAAAPAVSPPDRTR